MISLPNPMLLDGGLSAELEKNGCSLKHHLWTAHVLKNEPEKIKAAHLSYLKAGAQCLITSSYQATLPGFIASGETKRSAINLLKKTTEVAQEARDEYLKSNPYREIIIASSIGPYGAYLADGSEYTGNYPISRDLLIEFHQTRIDILKSSQPDIYAIETIPSYIEATILSDIIQQDRLPAWMSFSCRDESVINDGTPIEDCIRTMDSNPHLFALGVNCTAPFYIPILIQKIKKNTLKRIVIYPNSGEHYHDDTKTWTGSTLSLSYADQAKMWLELGASIIGGCCRIDSNDIAEMAKNC